MGYDEYYGRIDTVIMGKKTYKEVLEFDVAWPYSYVICNVVTNGYYYMTNTANTEALHQLDKHRIKELKSRSKKNIWLNGYD